MGTTDAEPYAESDVVCPYVFEKLDRKPDRKYTRERIWHYSGPFNEEIIGLLKNECEAGIRKG